MRPCDLTKKNWNNYEHEIVVGGWRLHIGWATQSVTIEYHRVSGSIFVQIPRRIWNRMADWNDNLHWEKIKGDAQVSYFGRGKQWQIIASTMYVDVNNRERQKRTILIHGPNCSVFLSPIVFRAITDWYLGAAKPERRAA